MPPPEWLPALADVARGGARTGTPERLAAAAAAAADKFRVELDADPGRLASGERTVEEEGQVAAAAAAIDGERTPEMVGLE